MRQSLPDKILIIATAFAFAGLVYCFTLFNDNVLAAIAGDPAAWVKIIFIALFTYFLFATVHSALLIKRYTDNKLFVVLAMIAGIAGMTTLAGDMIFLQNIAGLYEEGYGYSSQQQMLLLSLLIKFLALMVIAISILKPTGKETP